MSTIKEVREMMNIEYYFEEFNISIKQEKINFKKIKKEILKLDDDFEIEDMLDKLEVLMYYEEVAQVIVKDGYDITGFEIHEIPIPEIITFINYEDDRSFDIMKSDEDGLWRPAYIDLDENGTQCEPFANSIKEAIEKYNWTALTGETED